MSSEPPLRRLSDGAPIESSSVASPGVESFPTSACTARASAWSSSLQVGRPTRSMCPYIRSAITLLKCRGHAAPLTRYVISVSVMIAAPSAIRTATS